MKRGVFGYLFGLAVVVYIGWIVMAMSPMQRISRGCMPISWAGNLTVSLVAFLNPQWEAGTDHFFDRTDYVCRYSVWRLIYGQEWKKAHPGVKESMKNDQPSQGK